MTKQLEIRLWCDSNTLEANIFINGCRTEVLLETEQNLNILKEKLKDKLLNSVEHIVDNISIKDFTEY